MDYKITKTPKFKIGQFVKHKAGGASFINFMASRKLLIVEIGFFFGEETEMILYLLSYELDTLGSDDKTLFHRSYLTESEIELYDKE